MKYITFFVQILIAVAICSCTKQQKSSNEITAKVDSVECHLEDANQKSAFVQLQNQDTVLSCEEDEIEPENQTSESEPYDWVPEQFKKEHYDEWLVVKHAIDIEQASSNSIDYSSIDKLVVNYISKKGIELPEDKKHRIDSIEAICKARFDISRYDSSNMGMYVADGNERLFDKYIIWLLRKDAKKVSDVCIDLRKEEQQVKTVMKAFYICCDSIGYALDGSGGWVGRAEIDRMQDSFLRSMYEIILRTDSVDSLGVLLTSKHFIDESNARIAHFKTYSDTDTTPEDVKRIFGNYNKAMRRWLNYRSEVESMIQDSLLQVAYSEITRKFAKEHFVHLKNEFGDIGMMSDEMEKRFLPLDCSDKQMLDYKLEVALKHK